MPGVRVDTRMSEGSNCFPMIIVAAFADSPDGATRQERRRAEMQKPIMKAMARSRYVPTNELTMKPLWTILMKPKVSMDRKDSEEVT